VLEAKAAALRDEFPMVRIVRPSDGFVRLKVVADGAGAVGEEQAKACRSCANFGCAVSAIPTQMGAVFEDNCFSMACNTVKQGAYLKAKKAKEAGALPVDKRSGAVPANVRVVPSEAASNTTPRVVIDYRIAQWRQMLGVVVAKDASLALRFLVAFSLTGQGRWIDRSKLASAADKVTGRKLRTITLDDSLAAVDSIGQDGVAKLMPLVPASAAFGMDTSQLEVALAWAGVDEADHWTLNSTFLKLLTKSEIEAVADEIGLKAHLGAAFKKLAGGKKDELIAGLLAAKDFDFKGKVPRVMRYARRAEG
jgi:PRTRC genetic system ParB family protein